MLTIKCSACKKKLWKYDKVGQGEVLRCHKTRITKKYKMIDQKEDKIKCKCGNKVGIDKGTFYKMIAKSFTYSGTKRNS